MIPFILASVLSLLLSNSAIGAEGAPGRVDASQFKAAYAAFQAAQKQGNKVETHEYAMEALRLGEQLYGENHRSTAALTMNAALAYPTGWQGMPRPDSLNLMHQLVARYENLFGSQSVEVIEPLLLLAEALAVQGFVVGEDESPARARTRFESSEKELSEISNKIYRLVDTYGSEVDASTVLIRLSRLRVGDSEEMARTALQLRQSVLGLSHPLTLSSRYYYASNFLKESLLLEELKRLLDKDQLPPRLRFAALQQLSMKDTKDREQYAALLTQFEPGAEAPPGPPKDYYPISKVQPIYPRKAMKKLESGYVVVEFTVTETGSVEDVFVVTSCVYNSKRNCLNRRTFNKSAVAAAEKFQYIPRFVDGYPVRSVGVQNMVTYELY